MPDIYVVPDNQTDTETAALELLVKLPGEILRTNTLQDYYSLLHAEGAFAGLWWADAKQIAAAIAFDACNRGDQAADMLRNHARDALAGTDNMPWVDAERVARAFTVAADILGLQCA
jgi:hypothetical protein